MTVEALPGEVEVAHDAEQTAADAADWLLDVAGAVVEARGAFHVALSGGSTPGRLYELLAGTPRCDAGAWDRWTVWFSDERACPPDDERSNYNLAWRTLLRRVPVAPERINRLEGERSDLEDAAAEYAWKLAAQRPAGPGGAPRLDCVLLGLGENGHTASLFPGDPSLAVTDAWAVRSRADYEPFDRLTLTFPTINAAAAVAFLVTGEGKADAFRAVVDGSAPAARVRPVEGRLRWFLDRAAADSIP